MSALSSDLPVIAPQNPSPSLSSPVFPPSSLSLQAFMDGHKRLSTSSSSSSMSLGERRLSNLSSSSRISTVSFWSDDESDVPSIIAYSTSSDSSPCSFTDRDESKRPSTEERSRSSLDRSTGRRSSDLTSPAIAQIRSRRSTSRETQGPTLVAARAPTLTFPKKITVGSVTINIVLDTQEPSLPQESSAPMDKDLGKSREFTIRIPPGLKLSEIVAHQEDKGYPEVNWEGFELYCGLNSKRRAARDDWQLLTNVDFAWEAYLSPKELRKKLNDACIFDLKVDSSLISKLLEGRIENILQRHIKNGIIEHNYSEVEKLLYTQECNNTILTDAIKIDAYVTLLSRKIVHYTPEQIRSRLAELPPFPVDAIVHSAEVVKATLGYRLAIQDDLWVIFIESLQQRIKEKYEQFDKKAEIPLEKMKFSIKFLKDVLRTSMNRLWMQKIPEVPADIKEEFIRTVSQDWTKKELECVLQEREGSDLCKYKKRLQENGGMCGVERWEIGEYLVDHLVEKTNKEGLSEKEQAEFDQALNEIATELMNSFR